MLPEDEMGHAKAVESDGNRSGTECLRWQSCSLRMTWDLVGPDALINAFLKRAGEVYGELLHVIARPRLGGLNRSARLPATSLSAWSPPPARNVTPIATGLDTTPVSSSMSCTSTAPRTPIESPSSRW